MKLPKFNQSIILNHSLGFISVLLGVLIAFALNNWNENKKEQKIIKIALRNLKEEIGQNLNKIKISLPTNLNQIGFVDSILVYVDNDLKFPADRMQEMEQRFPTWSQTPAINYKQYQLTNIAWQTVLQTGILSGIDFDLAYTLSETYTWQSKVQKLDDDFFNSIQEIDYSKNSIQNLQKKAKLLSALAQILRDRYLNQCLEILNENLEER